MGKGANRAAYNATEQKEQAEGWFLTHEEGESHRKW